MVLPLIILGGGILLGGVLLLKNADAVRDITFNLRASDAERQFNLQQQRRNDEIKNRGALGNTFAFVFGEQAYAETFNNRPRPQPPQLGQEKDPQPQTTQTVGRSRQRGGRSG